MRMSNLFLAAAFIAGVAMADDAPLDVTITVVESPGDLPTAVTKTLALPNMTAVEHTDGHAQFGLDTANQARTLRHDIGQSVADQAKALGRAKAKGNGPP